VQQIGVDNPIRELDITSGIPAAGTHTQSICPGSDAVQRPAGLAGPRAPPNRFTRKNLDRHLDDVLPELAGNVRFRVGQNDPDRGATRPTSKIDVDGE
jgi:hypothetical protein